MVVDPDDIFCIYCQKQFQIVSRFVRHVYDNHRGVSDSLKEKYPWFNDIVQIIECENPY